jgi:chorismate mutase
MNKQFDYQQHLNSLRSEIEIIDTKIIALINQRLDTVKKIGKIKKAHDAPIIDIDRESVLKKLHHKLAKENQLDYLSIKKIFNTIITHSRDIQKG